MRQVLSTTGYGLDGPGFETWWGEIFHIFLYDPRSQPILLFNGTGYLSAERQWGALKMHPNLDQSLVKGYYNSAPSPGLLQDKFYIYTSIYIYDILLTVYHYVSQ
jgi:hypothetical protein